MPLYKKIFESSVEGIVVVNASTTIVDANPACHEIFGYAENELIGQPLDCLIPPMAKKAHTTHTKQFFARPHSRQMAEGMELKGQAKDGSTIPIEVSLTHMFFEDEPMVIALIIDVTERTKMESKLRQSEEKLLIYAQQLEEQVADRTEELAKTVKRLEKANEELADEVKIRLEAEKEAKFALEKQKELKLTLG